MEVVCFYRSGIFVFIVGVGYNIDEEELKIIFLS